MNSMRLDPDRLASHVVTIIKGALSPLVARIVALEARQVKDGERGPQGERGERGEPGERGPEGPVGAPGRDGLPGQPGRDGATGEKGLDGINGKDGLDGLGFDDLDVQYDGERGFTVTFTKGDRVKAFPFTLPVVLDRGVFKADGAYVRGDAVTWGGSLWIAKETTTQKPGDGASGWRLAVKRGSDGKEGKPGPQGPMGPRGDKGEDGRNKY